MYNGILPKCNFHSKEAKAWIRKMKTVVRNRAESIREVCPHICTVCGKRYRLRGNMTNCKKMCEILQERGLPCRTIGCDYVAKSRKELADHTVVCTFDKRCPFCGKIFQNAWTNQCGE